MKREAKEAVVSWAGAMAGVFFFALAYSLFLRPMGLYSGGFVGIAQIADSFLKKVIPLYGSVAGDRVGGILWCMNIPFFVLAYKEIGKRFFLKTVFCVTVQSFLLNHLPSPENPLFSEPLVSVIAGGALSGLGVGLTLTCGGSGGGLDIAGVYCAKKIPAFGVGKLSVMVNAAIYVFCALEYDLEVSVYSILFAMAAGAATDRVHYQNIKTALLIVSRNPDVKETILWEFHRGVTLWEGLGGYTEEKVYVCMTVVAKNEVRDLKSAVMHMDPKAFIVVQDHTAVFGNFEKRF